MLNRTVLAAVGISLLAAISPAQVLLSEPFNNNAAGWTLGTQWGIGPATSSAGCSTSLGGSQDPSSDADGKAGGGVAGLNIGGCAGTTLHAPYYIESPVIDATGSTNLKLEFDRWLNSDYPPYAQSTIDVWNGSAWVNIFANGAGVGVADGAWNHQSYNISAHASPRLKVRFGYAITGAGVFNVSGWNLDNVRITNGEYFFDRFRDNAAGWTLGTEWAIGNATAGGSAICTGTGDPGSDADGTSAGGVAGVVLGGDTTVAVHPHYFLTSPVINTAGAGSLVLQFNRWLNADYLNYMSSNVQVWDGGSWNTIFDTPCCSFTCDNAWVNLSYNITQFANAAMQVRFGVAIGQAFAVSLGSWNIDNLSIHDQGGSCTMQYSAYNGSGSLRISTHCIGPATPPGTQFFQCFTLQGGGPNWFFGINPSIPNDIIPQYTSGAMPFVGYSNFQGDLVFDVPGGIPPGIGPVYAVMVAIGGAGQVVNATPPLIFITL